MEFIAGNYYRTRGRQKYRFIGEKLYGDPYDKFLFEASPGNIISTSVTGVYRRTGISDYDIISEWQDNPKLIEPLASVPHGDLNQLISDLYIRLSEVIEVVNNLSGKLK